MKIGRISGRRIAGIIFVCAFACAPSLAGAQAINEVLELTPYRIRLVALFDDRPEWTQARREEIRSYLLARADSVIGAPWQASFLSPHPWMGAYLSERLETFVDGGLPDAWLDLPAEKILILRFSGAGGGFAVTGREFDLRTRLWSAPAPREFSQLELAGDEAFWAALDAFSPIGEITAVDENDKKKITVTFRAGALPVLDPELSFVQPADVLRPVTRFNDSTGKPRKIQPMDWTLLRVEKVDGAEAQCMLHSGLRNPISGKRRVEQLALAINRIPDSTTTLSVVARTPDARPLPGYGIYDYDPETKATALLGETDLRGEFVLEPTPAVLKTLAIKSGGETLARIVVAPGVLPAVTVKLPNDDRRLQVEGFIVGLQEQIVDWVVQREILLSRARDLIDKGEKEEAQKTINELNEMQRKQSFRARLDEQQAARAVADSAVQRKINKLFEDTRMVLQKFVTDKEIRELQERLAQIDKPFN